MEDNIAKPPKLESESDYFLRERGSYKILNVTPSLSLIPNDWTFAG